ncbi:molybdopterin molybdotransferase MoeA [Neolewinella aurantiaca]|uniref:Molybdopterin molybdenumtransferase n=1 Tax=Neolewinella aurantiaca TaxID=2602767 RepID=A0A5C7FUT8_9BACT|nr:molybdopterin molybdotransferase MoeA [Neolewinella aurantiaca]TXF88604.1 molybdopterin molybdotransferase MoeA [Neolewinella aurantiaca]
MLTDYHNAKDITLSQDFCWGEEDVRLAAAGGRILAAPLLTDRPQPPYDRVTMDGIAIHYAAYASGKRSFPVAGIVAAGTKPVTLTDPGGCLEVMTGAVLPPGTTTVIRYEDLVRKGSEFLLPEGIEDSKNIHWRGSDVEEGQELLSPGARIGGAAINLLAGCGYADVRVKKLPRVAIIATGDELVGVAEKPLPHQIRMSNVFHLRHQLATAGIEASTHHLADDKAELTTAITTLLARNDVLIFSGGVSKGKYDFLPEVLANLGVRKLLHRVAQRPGKPIWVGRTDETMVFGLPGNPVSSLTGLLAYVGPFLRQNLGIATREELRSLAMDFSFGKDLTLFQVVSTDPATQCVQPVANAGSGDASSMLRADGLLVLPRERSTFKAGEAFPFIPFDKIL